MPLAPVPQQRSDRELDYAGFVDDEAAHGVRDQVPALGQFADRVALIVCDAGVPSGSTVDLLWRTNGLAEGDRAGTELHPPPASGFQRENNQEPELVELGGGHADLQLGVLKAEWSLAARTVLELLAVSGLSLVELDGAVGELHLEVRRIERKVGETELHRLEAIAPISPARWRSSSWPA